MGLGAASEYALQKAGLAPKSTGNVILQGAIPLAGRVLEGVKGAFRFGANVMGRGQKLGEQAMADVLKVDPDPVARAYAQRASSAKYAAAEAAGELPTNQAQQAIRKAIETETALGSQADKATLKMLQGIETDLAAGTIDAKTAIAKAQRLQGKAGEAFKRGSSTKGKTLKEATEGFKEAIPGIKEADMVYTREKAVEDIFKASRKAKKVEALDELISTSKNADKIKSVISPEEMKDLRLIASRMMGEGADPGMVKWLHSGAVKSFLSDPNGVRVFRHAFGPTYERLKPERLAGMMTFIRAYNAQKEKQY
jgi:hypothetical protein